MASRVHCVLPGFGCYVNCIDTRCSSFKTLNKSCVLTKEESNAVDGDNGATISCTNCNIFLQDPSKMAKHKSFSKTGDNSLECDDCGAIFTSDCDLLMHYSYDKKNGFSCTVCSELFLTKFDLMCHIKSKHPSAVFTCFCDKVFTSFACLKYHESQVHGNFGLIKQTQIDEINNEEIVSVVKLNATKRNMKTVNSKYFTLSKNRKTKKKLVFSCTTCHVRYLTKSDVIKHYLAHHSETDPSSKVRKEVFPLNDCSVGNCDFKTIINVSSAKNFKRKRKVVTGKNGNGAWVTQSDGIKPILADQSVVGQTVDVNKKVEVCDNFKCDKCEKVYQYEEDLISHECNNFKEGSSENINLEELVGNGEMETAESEVNGKIVYHCNLCGKNIMTKRGFARHHRIHTNERPYTCHICGKQYRASADLTRHLRCVHEGIKNYSCDICKRSFANKSTMNDHRRTHTGERPYVCDICGKSFPTPNSIYVHRRIHTNYFPHECTSCDKRFRRRQQLIHHIRTHTGEKPHACEICGKCFGVKDELSRHRLTHSDEKPFSCSECRLCFGQKRYLKNHIRVHHNYLISEEQCV